MPSSLAHVSLLTRLRQAVLSRPAHLAFGLLVLLALAFAGYDATRTRPTDGTVWRLGGDRVVVLETLATSSSPATPLRRGDAILGIGSVITPTAQEAAAQLRRYKPGQKVSYLIRRDGTQRIVPVTLGSTRVEVRDYAVNVVLALIYLIIGFAVFLRSGNDRAANLFFTLCLMFSLYFTTNLQQVSYFLGALITQNLGAFARFMLPPVFLHFFLVFPLRKSTLSRHPFLSPLIYLLPLMFYFRFTIDQFVAAGGGRISAPVWMVLGVYYVLGLAALLHGYLSYRDPLMRQRVRILTYGTMLAVIPFLVFKIGLEELSYRPDLARLGAVPLAAIPISFGYCVARYQILHIDLLIKRNLAYGVLTTATWLAFFAGAWLLGGQVLGLLPGTSTLVSAGAILAVAAALWPLRLALQGIWIRRFYHSRDNLAAVIEEITREIPRHLQAHSLVQRVGLHLGDALGLPSLAFYLQTPQDGTFALEGLLEEPLRLPDGESDTLDTGPLRRVRYLPQLELPATAQALADSREPMWIDPANLTAEADLEAITREQALLQMRTRERARLAELGLQLLVPMVARKRLVGLMALPVRPGIDYEVHELRLLTIVAGQIALQLENSRLYGEEIAKQKLEEEMVMARRIQSRLLPGAIPDLSGFDIHAVNISSKQVSGDYYDLIERQDGKLAVIIADVSGKGMPASILASNIQAAVRAQCDICDSPAEILLRINRQLHAGTEPEHFATLFLALLDPQRRELVYSSGGHNAPVLLRADGSIERLEKGGLPLGAFDFGTYQEGVLSLGEGDLLFLYTDGLTEARRAEGGEDFGEERLDGILRARCGEDAGRMIAGITEDLAIYSGRHQHDDDVTMIALKVCSTAGKALEAGLAQARSMGQRP